PFPLPPWALLSIPFRGGQFRVFTSLSVGSVAENRGICMYVCMSHVVVGKVATLVM
uniref:Uncharacterized protein n=1 Tax=Aegilops tauschii subsp. strangulata TaxID=200361 RepID=A0A453AG98_AEGTS